ncbi:MAG TPA: O-antigen ligase family protein, partial [Cellvibrio sp.]
MSFLRVNELWRHYLSGRFSLEFIVCVGLFSAIILFNRGFTHINYKQVYVTEFCILFASLLVFGKLLLAGRPAHAFALLVNPLVLLIIAILALGVITLLLSLENGTLAIKQSVIFLYASFVLLFSFSLRDREMLLRWLILSAVLISIYVAVKLGIYLSLGITYEHERWRVVHDEADVIFCSLATLGLLLFREEFCKKSQVLFYLLLALNLMVLVLTMKRTAFIGLFAALLFCFIHMRWLAAIRRQHLYWLFVVIVLVIVAALVFPQLSHPLEQIVRSKLDVLNEGNSAWRIVAWQEALARFYQEPYLG